MNRLPWFPIRSVLFSGFFLLIAGLLGQTTPCVLAQTVSLASPPTRLERGKSYEVDVVFNHPNAGVVQVQLCDANWGVKANPFANVTTNSGTKTLTVNVPADLPVGDDYFFQAIVYDSGWNNPVQSYVNDIEVFSNPIRFVNPPPTTIQQGQSLLLPVDYVATEDGFVQVQLVNSAWSALSGDWTPVSAGSDDFPADVTVPANAPVGGGYRWQAVVYNDLWQNVGQEIIENVTIQASGGGGGEWLPPISGSWSLDWEDTFDNGTGNWFPFLGYTPEEYANNNEKGLRWAGATEDTAWMYSTKTGHHSTNSNGELEMEIVCKNPGTANSKVETAYLLTGKPLAWDNTEPGGVKWGGGKFVSPNGGETYISARVKTGQVVGWSTWFAFWMHSPNRAYNNNPADGTEVDLIEIAKGNKQYLTKSFNVANHWKNEGQGGSESFMFHNTTNPKSTDLVDVTDNNWHTYGLHWKTTSMDCYVDGQLYYTFTENIPSNPVDMMMFLTLEFKKDQWDPNQGDGRIAGPTAVPPSGNTRVMSKAFVDYVRVYQKN